jgi:hypothetical protein
VVILLAAAVAAATPPGAAAFVRDHRLVRYAVGVADLNDDGKAEALVYPMDASDGVENEFCGSGGCDLYVLSLSRTGYRVVTAISITRPPIRVLPTKTHGRHDLAVFVAGGGIIRGYEARLRFNGRSYPENPTVPPATRLESPRGKVVIRSVPPVPRQ